jgi:penicillin amidase/acyl-homoserine-lactone acylase
MPTTWTRRAAGALLACASLLLAAPTQAAPAYDATIRRDNFGVPHVLGKTDADAAYGLGFAQSEDDFATVQDSVMASRGRQATLKGPDAVPSDILFALMNVKAVLDAGYERDLSPHIRGMLDGYAAGVNRYAALHPDKVVPGFLPMTGRDLAAFTLFRGPTFYGLDGVFAQIATGKLPEPKDSGSNGVAVAPGRSADGHTRLLFNAHQPWSGPLTWYEAVVESGEGWHVAGGFFPASPFLLGGHNAHLGWAATVNHPRLTDVYKLVINPANPNQYRVDGKWRELERRTVEIQVKQPDGSLKPVSREVLRSVHGPVIRGPQGVFAVRYPTSGGVRQLAQNYAMNKARTLAEWKAAMALQAVPSVNYIYADEKGNIGYLSNGIYAERKAGVDWSGPYMPGDKSDLIWTKVRPFSQSPQIWNPKSGWVFNANNTPFRATDPAHDLKPADFPASMALQPPSDMTNRAFRALETYGADSSISAAEFDTYKYDLAYSAQSDEAAWVKAVLAADAAGDGDLAAAQDALRKWDGSTDLHNRGAALVALMWLERRRNPGWTPVQMVKSAAGRLKAAYGRVDPEWGEVNRLRRGPLDIPVDGGPDTFRALYGALDPDGRLRGVNGDCYIMFVEWDAKGRMTSRSVHQYGSATLDASSPHYADQSPLFAAHKTKPVLFTEAQLAGHIARTYRPGEATP